ncbi:MAG TPA: hypothetical protein PLY90_07100 [Candidatus Hydrogenedentes bacterium]|nr:hypothetical protein [Candidatus Hydrogenedentota bacterium]HQB03047.1 hypothetical protein [Candidatus Hydrogenedentota bacterium]
MTTAILIVLLGFSQAAPDVAAALLAEGEHCFQQGNYKEAADLFCRAHAEQGVCNPALFFNLGNAWQHEGSSGRAILYYEAALMLDPGFAPARQNLALALEKSRRNLPLPDRRMLESPVLRYMPLKPLHGLYLTHALFLVASVFALLLYWKSHRRYLVLAVVSVLAALLLFGWTLAANQASRSLPQLAVACSEEVPVYFSTRESDTPRFVLYEGDRVFVDRTEGEWLRVCVQGGEKGWAKKDLIGVVESVFH